MYSLVTLSLPSRYSLELPSYIYTFSIFCLPHMHFQSHSHTLAFYYHSHTLSSTITTTLSIYPFHLPLLTPFPSTPSSITHTLSIYPFHLPSRTPFPSTNPPPFYHHSPPLPLHLPTPPPSPSTYPPPSIRCNSF